MILAIGRGPTAEPQRLKPEWSLGLFWSSERFSKS